MRLTTLVRLYPPSWRRRYGDEMVALLETRGSRPRQARDLARGVVDAWLHPLQPSWLPPAAALVGGGVWTAVAAATVIQPSPLDWPGYLVDAIPAATVAVVALLVATIGCALRTGDAGGRPIAAAIIAVIVGWTTWIVALVLTMAAAIDPPTLAAGQALAMLGTLAVGVLLVRAGDALVGLLLVIGAGVMLLPWVGGWLAFGAAWTGIGIALVAERLVRQPDDLVVS